MKIRTTLLTLAVIGTMAFLPALSTVLAEDVIVPETELVTSMSGLKFKEVVKGTGEVAKKGQTVAVHYTGWLYPSGQQIDTSRNSSTPLEFKLGTRGIIKGWNEVLEGMHVGDKRIIILPPDLAYGKAGKPPVVPPNATLKFEIELMDVK